MLSRLLIQYHSVTLLKKKQTQIDRRQDKNTTAYYFYLSRPQLPRPLEMYELDWSLGAFNSI